MPAPPTPAKPPLAPPTPAPAGPPPLPDTPLPLPPAPAGLPPAPAAPPGNAPALPPEPAGLLVLPATAPCGVSPAGPDELEHAIDKPVRPKKITLCNCVTLTIEAPSVLRAERRARRDSHPAQIGARGAQQYRSSFWTRKARELDYSPIHQQPRPSLEDRVISLATRSQQRPNRADARAPFGSRSLLRVPATRGPVAQTRRGVGRATLEACERPCRATRRGVLPH